MENRMSWLKETYDNKKEKRYSKYIRPIIPIIFFILISLLFPDNEDVFFQLTEVICASLGTSVGIICLLNFKMDKENFYNNIGIGFLFISIIAFGNILINNGLKLFNSIKVEYIMNISMLYLEYVVIILAFLFTKEEDVHISKIISHICICIVGIFGLVTYLSLNINYIPEKIYIPSIMMIPVFTFLWILIYFEQTTLSKEEKRLLYEYLVFTILHQVFYIFYKMFDANMGYIAEIFKYFSYYTIFNIVSTYVLRKSYILMKNGLIESQETEKELNGLLQRRNKTLMELEHLIETSGERYEQLIQAVSDGVIIFYFNKVYYMNVEALNMLELRDASNVLGMNFDKFIDEVLLKDGVLDTNSIVVDQIKSIEEKDDGEFQIEISKDENHQYLLYVLNIDNMNRLIYIKNVTEINRNHILQRKYNEYLKAEKLKNEFYSNISHELRTPINIIYSALQLNEVNINDSNIKNVERQNETIKHNCLRLIRTINNFIDTNKISEGYLNPNFKIYNIISVIENITLACNRYMEKKNNSLLFEPDEEEYYVKCDKDMMERVILNILSNSLKFGKEGGMTSVRISANEKKVIVTIRNNGYIVAEEVKPYMFDKFTKLNKSLNRTAEGSGLGLYLTKALLELQQGEIALESNDDIGTVFTITLPRCYDMDMCEEEEDFEMMDTVNEKVDIEFSDIYI